MLGAGPYATESGGVALVNSGPRPKLLSLSDASVHPIAVLREYEAQAVARYGPFISGLVAPMYRALRDRIVAGFAVMHRRTPVAALGFVRYGRLVRITLLHCREAWRGQGHECSLLEAALTELAAELASGSKVVCEAMVICHPGPDELFSRYGFTVVPREIMVSPIARPARQPVFLAGTKERPTVDVEGQPLVVRPWGRSDAQAAANTLCAANAGTVDGLIYPELVDERLALHAVDGITGGSSGPFEPRASFVATAPGSGEIVGLTMSTRSAARAGFLTEIAVLPEWQGRGLGRILLGRTLVGLRRASYRSVRLAVTSGNERARRLYLNHGFTTVERFGSYYMA